MTEPASKILKFHPADEGAALREPLDELLLYLAALHERLRSLDTLAGRKLAGLRSADAAALEACAAEESAVLQDVFRAAQGRGAVVARLAQVLHLEEPATLRLSRIAEALPEPHASVLRARIAALQAAATELQRKNRLAAAVAQHLQGHIRDVFASLAQACQEAAGYGPQGKRHMTRARSWVDAVG